MKQPRRIAAYDNVGPGRGIPPFDPAVKLWQAHGLDCAIYISGMLSSFNGYVRLPDQAPDRVVAEAYDVIAQEEWRKNWGSNMTPGHMGYDALLDIEVHGGLTYGPDDEGWVGFDTGHAWDDWSDELLERYIRPRTEEGWQHFLHMQQLVGKDMWPPGRLAKTHGLHDAWDVNWTMEKLEAEVERLAFQIYARLHVMKRDE